MDIQDEILYRNSNIICNSIDECFYVITNPLIDNGMKIINRTQKSLFDSINGKDTIHSISEKLKLPLTDTIFFINSLKEKQFVSVTNSFAEPSWSNIPYSLNLWIQTTNNCNLRCSYCYIHTLGMSDYFTKSHIDQFTSKLVETVKNNHLKLVQLRLAGGEPFLRFSIWESVIPELKRRLQDAGCSLKVVILTNLVALNEHILNFIKQNAIGIAVSIDGVGKYHNQTRHFNNGQGSFDIVNNNIDTLIHYGINPTLMSVISNSNLDGICEFTNYVIDKNLKHRYSFVSGEDIDLKKLTLKMRLCYELYENAIIHGYEFSQKHKLCDLKFDKLAFQTCSNGYNGGALYTDGNLYFCQRHFGVNKPLGSIYEEDDILSIIHRKTYYNDVSIDCKSCLYRYMCTSGCPIERTAQKDPHCSVYKELIPIILRLRGKERLCRIQKVYNQSHLL